ncbi:MAG: phytanoyl-CoA dioxygenase family protein, partial [Actinomycetota bacterium]|nr:phytanoyl-CoA dioxygenase family protein [Actinomycetota bacterium]
MTAAIEHVEDVYPTRLEEGFSTLPRQDQVVWGTAADGPMDQQALDSYDERGYLTIPDLVTPEEVAELRAELHRLSNDPETRADE